MGRITFLHAADLHLDSPLRGLERYEGAPVDELRGATRAAFDNLVNHAIDSAVDLVLLAGDIYDGDWRDYQSGLFFNARLARLNDAGIAVVMIRGNHDAASRISKSLRLPPRCHDLRTDEPQSVVFDDLGVVVHGQGYATQAVSADLAATYPAAVPSLFNIGLLHTSMDGREGHAPYAPTSLATLVSRGYDYWALGHVHQREVLHARPWVVFSGNLQGRHARETGAKGCTEVVVEDGVVLSVEALALDVVRWAQVEVDASSVGSIDAMLDRVRAALEVAAQPADGRMLAARIRVSGVVDRALQSELQEDAEHVRSQVRSVAQTVAGGRVWIEKAFIDTRAQIDLDAVASREDPLGDLVRWMRGLDDEAVADLARDLTPLAKKLPAGLIDTDGPVDDPAAVRALLPELERMLVPMLIAQGETR